jgi:hypothetical protein
MTRRRAIALSVVLLLLIGCVAAGRAIHGQFQQPPFDALAPDVVQTRHDVEWRASDAVLTTARPMPILATTASSSCGPFTPVFTLWVSNDHWQCTAHYLALAGVHARTADEAVAVAESHLRRRHCTDGTLRRDPQNPPASGEPLFGAGMLCHPDGNLVSAQLVQADEQAVRQAWLLPQPTSIDVAAVLARAAADGDRYLLVVTCGANALGHRPTPEAVVTANLPDDRMASSAAPAST